MLAEPVDLRRCVAVKLSDVPFEARLEALRFLSRYETDPTELQALLSAAVFPSDEIYWIAP